MGFSDKLLLQQQLHSAKAEFRGHKHPSVNKGKSNLDFCCLVYMNLAIDQIKGLWQ
jgi:hypothetical protein